MPSPDLSQYVDLRLFDKDPQDIFDEALTDLQTRLPEWTPREGNTEVLVLESGALEVAEAVFAINRLPGAIVEILVQLFGVLRDLGAQPTTTLTFNLADTLGHDIPAGTQVRLDLVGGLLPIVFSTDEALSIPVSSSTGTVSATGDRFTADANGVASGTIVALLDAISFVDTVVLASDVVSGRDVEDDLTWLTRAVQRFQRISETLVLPKHFTAEALENPAVKRAFTIDNYTPATIPTPTITSVTTSGTGGTLTAATYSYRVSAVNAAGQTLASTAVTRVVSSGTTNSNTVNWSAVVVPPGVSPLTNYKVYGRAGGTELLIATVGAATLTYVDTGSVTPSGALPSANTTGPAPGTAEGFVTVAVYGDGAFLSGPEKAALDASFEALAMANLDVSVIDPTITSVNVTAAVHPFDGFSNVDVIANVTAALEDYLSPGTWPWAATVRRNELISVISNAEGVDYVDSITVPASDVSLVGVAPLADAGTLTITAV